jgi:ABC-type Fe3+-hydroxamate transport system substrate-binding protein
MTLVPYLRNVFLWTLLSAWFASTAIAGKMTVAPQRIVSLSLASDEILIELLPQCGGLERLKALSVYADDPASSNIRKMAKLITHRVHSEPESLFRLNPDLVIGATFNRTELLDAIKARNVRLLTLNGFSNASDIARHIHEIGTAIHCEQPAAKMAKDFMDIVNVAPQALKQKPRLLSYSADLTIMGDGTLFNDLVVKSGGINAASSRNLKLWPRVDTETLLTLDPDIIVILGQDTPSERQAIKTHAAWGRLKAVRNNRFIFLTSQTALSTSRYFAEAIQELRTKLIQGTNLDRLK